MPYFYASLKVGLPRSMPYFYASLKVAITLAFVGTVQIGRAHV